jgi:Zn-dependent peptidase ImmA (M78 family)
MPSDDNIEERRAYEVIAEVGYEGPPLNFAPILERYGIDLILRAFNYVGGVMIKDPVYTLLVVNENDPEPRRRFTIAHELGHFFLGHEGRRFAEPSSDDPPQERAANRFAAALLMPENWLRAAWEDYRDNPDHRPDIIAEMFGVSVEALKVRLKELRITDAPGKSTVRPP